MGRGESEKQRLERLAGEIGRLIANAVTDAEALEGLPLQSLAFMFVIADVGPSGFQAYAGNVARPEAISVLSEILDHLRGGH